MTLHGYFEAPHIPLRPFLTSERVSLHRPGCALTCSTYILHCSISSEPPDPIMAPKWPFWALLGSYWGPPTAPLTPKTVPMHHWGCALTCSTCSTLFRQSGATTPPFGYKMTIWAIWDPFGVLLIHKLKPFWKVAFYFCFRTSSSYFQMSPLCAVGCL